MMKKASFIGAIVTLIFVLTHVASADVPQLISFQGKLHDNAGNPLTGQYEITFRIYNGESGGTHIWTETRSVDCDDGLYHVILGQTSSLNLDFDGQYWLGVQLAGDDELSPRYRLVSAPYAFRAEVADQVTWTGLTDVPEGFADGIDDVGEAGGISRINAGPGIIVENPVGPTATVAADIGYGADKVAAGNHNHDEDYVNEGQVNSVTSSMIVDGTIQEGDLSFMPGGDNDWMVNGGNVYRESGNVGIGTTRPIERLEVAGTVYSSTGGFKFPDGTTQTTAVTGGASWGLCGNSGTTPGTNFLGTTDNQPLEFHVNGARALRLEPDGESPNVIGGYSGNNVAVGIHGATIGGGGASGFTNSVTSNYGTVGGGESNQASGSYATVGGGLVNTASGYYTTVGGGTSNQASGYQSTVGGGNANTASGSHATVGGGDSNITSGNYTILGGGLLNTAIGDYATVGGGNANTASGFYATVPGGYLCNAQGAYSFAAGRRAKANHHGAFVWADYTTYVDFASTGQNQFLIRATGGVGIGTNSPSYTLDVAGPVNLNKGGTGGALRVNGAEAIWYNGTYFSWGYGGTFNYFADNVGINTSAPAYTLDVAGAVHASDYQTSSDSRFKKDVTQLSNVLEKLDAIRGGVFRLE